MNTENMEQIKTLCEIPYLDHVILFGVDKLGYYTFDIVNKQSAFVKRLTNVGEVEGLEKSICAINEINLITKNSGVKMNEQETMKKLDDALVMMDKVNNQLGDLLGMIKVVRFRVEALEEYVRETQGYL